MAPEPLHKAFIITMLGLLTVSAFFIRLDNFKNSELRSIDEVVYYRMALQVLDEGPSGYHTIPYGRELAAQGRPLPPYFFQPLFKHPPLFTFLTAGALKLFGKTMSSAVYVPLLFGALMIPAAYVLGALLLHRGIGICAAVFMWLDPVSVMASQKVWMDSPLAFFMLASFILFVLGLKSEKGSWFILAGVAGGLAVLTKYSGILPVLSVGLFALVYRRDLYRQSTFVTGLLLPLAMSLPWLYWNYLVFGSGFLMMQKALHRNEQLYVVLAVLIGSAAVLIGALRVYRRVKEKHVPRGAVKDGMLSGLTRQKVDAALGIALVIVVFKNIVHGLDFQHLPRTSWAGSVFKLDPPTFYVAQLLEYSFIYFFAFASFFIGRRSKTAEFSLLRYAVLVTLVFFTFWKSYQCRYILFAVPLLAVMAFEMIFAIYGRLMRIGRFVPRLLCKSLFLMLIMYGMAKTLYVDLALAFTNDMCYF